MRMGKAHAAQPGGFTLIEVMITVAIVAILASVAVPSYQNYLIRGRIPDATSQLASRRVLMEQFFQDNKTYLGAPLCAAVDTTTSKHFSFDCDPVPTGTTFKLRATGTGSMTGFVYTLDQSNTKVTTGVPSGWTTSTTCWVTTKAGTC
jgi:type IV pilus assembly protein PilE